jgi:8-oxo-dGTP pyrophosphatase MutT (NUDIX family)
LEITPLPEWIHTDIRFEVFRNASLDGPLSITDEKLVERIDNSFSLNPWVARVVRVSKHASARVKVELVYRRPVCMVEVPGDLLPVDAHGVLLPYGNDDFSPVEKSRYPLLVGITSARVAVGECWGDPRVVGGAEIAAAVREVWEELQLQRIQPSDPFDTGVAEEPTYKLFSRGGAVIFWGRAPGTKVPGELPAAEKVARLLEYVRLYGPLKTASGSQMLDVHKLPDSSGVGT